MEVGGVEGSIIFNQNSEACAVKPECSSHPSGDLVYRFVGH